ncbi:ATP-binding protein [Actinomadura opuntiae]|uniref:ATP-binding protein n=1 Tax=Actinomadura sp. OS1-43 TaxID=604315 RepID=UPI00255B24BE|nr:ATP-binding protein [Actinomadura sp. OS1-43]MDL4815945.1 ATP-binding protein [Actinomadura sp. OS1-43]
MGAPENKGTDPGGLVVVGTLTLPGAPRSVGYARRFLRDMVPPDHPGLDDLVTVVSELVCNAVTHTASGDGGRVTVSLLAGEGFLRMEIADDGADGRRPRLKAETGAESGRGLRIVDVLTRSWGFRPDGPGTVVWAEFRSVGRVLFRNPDMGLSRDSSTLMPTAFEGGEQ